jgi:CheY-like chemotaxis protein
MKQATVVLAEDDAANQRLFQMVLEDCGYRILVASNGREVLHILETDGVDLVLMDIHMPGMDGLETVKRIRASEKPYSGVPVIGVTAHAGLPERRVFLDAGMNAFEPKPVDLGRLIETIDRLLAQSPLTAAPPAT